MMTVLARTLCQAGRQRVLRQPVFPLVTPVVNMASAPQPLALLPVERTSYVGKNIIKDTLEVADKEVYDLILKERARQVNGLELIASENFMSRAVRETLGSCLINKYSEGLPGARYYGGNEYIDQLERLCQQRALDVYGLNPDEWGVNVQPYSGSPANLAVYTALVEPHGRIMGLDLPDGGHLTHGFYTEKKKISATSMFFESMPYKVDSVTGLIDYDKLEENARLFKPKLIIAGVSCYSRHLDYARFRDICNQNNSILHADMAHIGGLVAAGVVPSPFEYADTVMTTTHKSLRGARGALIFFRKGVRSTNAKGEKTMYDFEAKINASVFPGLQGGPHNHSIGGISVCLAHARTKEFVEYQKQVLSNSQTLAGGLVKHGYAIATGGTENHLCLLDVRPLGLDGARVELVLDNMHITTNKNTCPGDKSALKPGGIRLGTPALTSRGMGDKDFAQVAEFLHEGIQLTLKHNKLAGPTLREFREHVATNADFKKDAAEVGERVKQFSSKFEMPGPDNY